MLSIHNLQSSGQAATYYERDDYYASRDREEARWSGRGAEQLGLAGEEVEVERFRELLDGHIAGDIDIQGGRGGERRPGMDLTFSAPKSVSLMALVGDDERILEAHDRAVDRSLQYLEERAAYVRITRDGEISRVPSEGFVVAQFRHDTARPVEGHPDPQLHTHAVVINATRAAGRWRALSNEELYRSKMLGGAIYRAELATELRGMGYEVKRTGPDGQFEIRGFTREQLEHFSKRRQLIEEELADRGLSGARAAKEATVRTRESKERIHREELHRQWQQRAAEQGIDFERMRETDRTLEAQVEREGIHTAEGAVEYAVDHLTERQSVMEHREILQHAVQRSVGHSTLDEIETELEEARERGDLLAAGEGRYTTREALRRERETLAMVQRGQGRGLSVCEPETADRALRAYEDDKSEELGSEFRFTEGQREAATLILSRRDRVVGVQGFAGTGKTTMLEAIREQSEARGWTVKGAAVSASAAQVLEEETGIESQTVASRLHALQRETPGPPDRQLWIVDESSMLGTKDAHELLRQAERRGARVAFVGDRAQLPAIQAGKPFAMLSDRGMQTATMQRIQRQRNAELKRAVEHSVSGRQTAAVRVLDPSIRQVENREHRLEAVARDYVDRSPRDRKRTLVVTGSNADRRQLNDRIRQGLREQNHLSGARVASQVLVNQRLTEAESRQAATYEQGDVIRFGRDYSSLGVTKGSTAAVERVDRDKNIVELRTEEGDRVSWRPHRLVKTEAYTVEERDLQAGDLIRWTRNDHPRGRHNGELATVTAVDADRQSVTVENQGETQTLDLSRQGHWDHGYASTVHAAQGRTVDRVVCHIDTRQTHLTGQASWYVSISRARHEARIYTDHRGRLPDAVKRLQEQKSALEEREQWKETFEARLKEQINRTGDNDRNANDTDGPSEGRAGREARSEPSEAPREATPDGATLTKRAVHKQLTSMGADRFDIGLIHEETGQFVSRRGWSTDQVDKSISWLRHMNREGYHVRVKPADDNHRMTLVSGVSRPQIEQMTEGGFEPATVIEASPDRYEVWIKHHRPIDPEVRQEVSRDLATRFGGDGDASGQREYGRLAGFTNRNAEHQNVVGLSPYVLVREAHGTTHTRSREYVRAMEKRVEAARERAEPHHGRGADRGIRDIEAFHTGRYAHDLHRADQAWATYAARRGAPFERIERTVLTARDLQKKGDPERQWDYAYRTAKTACETVGRDKDVPSRDQAHKQWEADGRPSRETQVHTRDNATDRSSEQARSSRDSHASRASGRETAEERSHDR